MAVNILMSYAYYAKTDIRAIRNSMPCGRILIDSGAFTAWSTGKVISLQEYAEYLQHYEGVWNHAVTLDTIGDPAATRKNTLKLHGMGIGVMPVFTVGDTLAEFDSMIRDSGYVCVGGTVGMNKEHQTKRLAMLQRRAEGMGGGIHALGVASMPSLRRIRPYSADASNISGAFRFGSVVYWNHHTRRMENCPVNDRKRLMKAAPYLARHGINITTTLAGGKLPDHRGRNILMRKMSYSYAVADEVLKQECEVPVPNQITDNPGTHLYNSIVPTLVSGASSLDAEIHSGTTPPVWSPYKKIHTCSPQKVTA